MKKYDLQIIANLMAGKGEAKKKLEDLKDFLKKNKKTYLCLEVKEPTPISQIPEDGKVHLKSGVICIGGDGTVSETVGYVLNNNINLPIAIIPTGTANIIANSLNLTGQTEGFELLLGDRVQEIDIGVAEYGEEKDYFLLGLGLGFEEKFLKLAKEKVKSKLGVLSYFLAAIAELLSLRSISLKIENSEVQIKTQVCLLTVLNLHPKIFKLFPLSEHKDINGSDGRLNLFFVEYKNYFYSLLGTLLFHVFGGMDFGLVKRYSGESFFIQSPQVVGTQLDGELRAPLPVKLSVNKQKGKFFIP